MLATAGAPAAWSAVTQSTPAITPLMVPEPLQSRTRTATRSTFLATPYVVPPTIPATCVPWPWQSWPFRPSATASKPTRARLRFDRGVRVNWRWVVRMPVSIT